MTKPASHLPAGFQEMKEPLDDELIALLEWAERNGGVPDHALMRMAIRRLKTLSKENKRLRDRKAEVR